MSPRECIFITCGGATHLYAHTLLQCLSQTGGLTHQAIYASKPSTLTMQILRPSIFFLMHYVISSAGLSFCCQSILYRFPLRLRYSTLVCIKAGTVCQPEAPCGITVCAAFKKSSRSTRSIIIEKYDLTWDARAGGEVQLLNPIL